MARRAAGTAKIIKFTNVFNNDLKNKYKYGILAPLFAERIWVDPKSCEMAIHSNDLTGMKLREDSGYVIESRAPFEKLKRITEVKKIKYCINHWVHGIPWEKSGAYEHTKKYIADKGINLDGCKTDDDVIERFERIELMYEQIKNEKRLRTRKEINPFSFREHGGVYIHLGPNGEPIFGEGGNHRFAIAMILGLNLIPAQLGCVHINAIPYLPLLRSKR